MSWIWSIWSAYISGNRTVDQKGSTDKWLIVWYLNSTHFNGEYGPYLDVIRNLRLFATQCVFAELVRWFF